MRWKNPFRNEAKPNSLIQNEASNAHAVYQGQDPFASDPAEIRRLLESVTEHEGQTITLFCDIASPNVRKYLAIKGDAATKEAVRFYEAAHKDEPGFREGNTTED